MNGDIALRGDMGSVVQYANQLRGTSDVFRAATSINLAISGLRSAGQSAAVTALTKALDPLWKATSRYVTYRHEAANLLSAYAATVEEMQSEARRLQVRLNQLEAQRRTKTLLLAASLVPDPESRALAARTRSDLNALSAEAARVRGRLDNLDLTRRQLDARTSQQVDSIAAQIKALARDVGPELGFFAMLATGRLGGAARKLKDAVVDEFTPPDGMFGQFLWGLGWAIDGSDAIASGLFYFKYGHFAPRIGGQIVKPASTLLGRGLQATKPDSWVAKPNAAGASAKLATASKVLGVAAVVVSFAQGAWDQWSRDKTSDLKVEERVKRSTYRGGTVAASSFAGATGGAKLGGIIGALGGPPGAAIGVIAGGLIGGVVGAAVGNLVADETVDAVGKVPWGVKLMSGPLNALRSAQQP